MARGAKREPAFKAKKKDKGQKNSKKYVVSGQTNNQKVL